MSFTRVLRILEDHLSAQTWVGATNDTKNIRIIRIVWKKVSRLSRDPTAIEIALDNLAIAWDQLKEAITLGNKGRRRTWFDESQLGLSQWRAKGR